MTSHLVTWGSIELLHNVARTLRYLKERQGDPLPSVSYRAKVKLHGTNASVQRTATAVTPQSRSRVLTLQSDNKGFARWVRANETYFETLQPGVTVFGEWCGPGVEKGVAISKLDRKVLAVFALQIGTGDGATLVVDPERIDALLPTHPDIHVVPWLGSAMTLDYSTDMSSQVERINEMVAEVEREDPWVKDVFDVSGFGEGLVLYPVAPVDRDRFFLLAFKAKGEKHRTAATKKPAQISPEVARDVRAFVDLVVTEARLQQGVTEACAGELDMRQMGAFIRWVSADTQKESIAELEASGLTWKQVGKGVSERARNWYKDATQRGDS